MEGRLPQQILRCDSSLLFRWFVTFLSKRILLPWLPQQLSPACLSAQSEDIRVVVSASVSYPLHPCIYLCGRAVLVIYKPVMHHPPAMKDNYRLKGAMGLIF